MSSHVDACAVLFRLTGEGCCVSCAEDEAMGYPISEIESPDRRRRFWASVCCAHANMEPDERDPARRLWWAILLRARRRDRGKGAR